MIVERSFDAEYVNAVVNAPEVRPFIGPGDYLDLSEAVARPENWFLMGEHGGFALIWSAPGVHEVHTFILREGRGRWARQAASDGVAFAASQGDRMLWTKIPDDQPNVALYARAMGMQDTGVSIETFGKPYAVYKMELDTCQRLQ